MGESGAGKSSLVGLLLGWHRPVAGRLLVDGKPLKGEHLQTLRQMTAWVDPSVQIWNRPLQENLRYGNSAGNGLATEVPIGTALEGADLYDVLERLPNGLQTRLGEGGGLVSGGEGQRVRLGRALLRSDVRLAILDEPFRGLDRAKRQQLLANARQQWQDATLLCITHDIAETQDFTRVLVIEDGHIVEDGAPQTLLEQPTSRYRNLLEADESVHGQRWTETTWRRLWLEGGKLDERGKSDARENQTHQEEPTEGSPTQTKIVVANGLRQIKGIGPVWAERLQQAGVRTIAELATFSMDEFEVLVTSNGWPVPQKIGAWIEQAQKLENG